MIIDEATREAQRQQLNAERERRAVIARAEGEKRSVELAAEAKLFEAEKEAEAIKVNADASAYSVQVKAKADAEQTRLLAAAIADNGQAAVNFEVMKRQVDAMSEIAASRNSKTIIMPTDIVKAIGSLELLLESFNRPNDAGEKSAAGPWDKSK